MLIRIKNLRLHALIGLYEWERKGKQEVIVNVEFEFDGEKPARTDTIEDSVDYKTLTKKIITDVEESRFQLLEALSSHVLNLVMADGRVKRARVEVDKPGALRFAESVSVVATAER